MPFVERAGAKLNYRVVGEGPVVVLQHPLSLTHKAFGANGLRNALVSAGYRCVTPDSIAHGDSSVPFHRARYGLADRAADVLAVVDALGVERFAFVGYSMGAWIGTGLMEIASSRMASITLAGWDLLEGARLFTAEIDREKRHLEFSAWLKQSAEALGTPTPAGSELAGLLNCYDELFEPLPELASLAAAGVPTTILCGESDPYFNNMKKAAAVLGAPFLPLPGDHIGAFMAAEFRDVVVRMVSVNF